MNAITLIVIETNKHSKWRFINDPKPFIATCPRGYPTQPGYYAMWVEGGGSSKSPRPLAMKPYGDVIEVIQIDNIKTAKDISQNWHLLAKEYDNRQVTEETLRYLLEKQLDFIEQVMVQKAAPINPTNNLLEY